MTIIVLKTCFYSITFKAKNKEIG
uniref:Uncharacterized protein n=1 Tax=Anguilla anguilla TaxID=7936 RepID=A0A0E9VTK5_ANGAN